MSVDDLHESGATCWTTQSTPTCRSDAGRFASAGGRPTEAAGGGRSASSIESRWVGRYMGRCSTCPTCNEQFGTGPSSLRTFSRRSEWGFRLETRLTHQTNDLEKKIQQPIFVVDATKGSLRVGKMFPTRVSPLWTVAPLRFSIDWVSVAVNFPMRWAAIQPSSTKKPSLNEVSLLKNWLTPGRNRAIIIIVDSLHWNKRLKLSLFWHLVSTLSLLFARLGIYGLH